MRLTPQVMAYWVIIFCFVWVADTFQLLQKYNLDDKSVGIGFILGALMMKFAPDPNKDYAKKTETPEKK